MGCSKKDSYPTHRLLPSKQEGGELSKECLKFVLGDIVNFLWEVEVGSFLE